MGWEDASQWRADNAGGYDGSTRCRRDGRMQDGGRHLMPLTMMVAAAVRGTGGCKLGTVSCEPSSTIKLQMVEWLFTCFKEIHL